MRNYTKIVNSVEINTKYSYIVKFWGAMFEIPMKISCMGIVISKTNHILILKSDFII